MVQQSPRTARSPREAMTRLRRFWTAHTTPRLRKTVLLVLIVLLAIYLPLAIATQCHDPDILSTAILRAERVSVDVADPNGAAFHIVGFKVTPFGSNPADAPCRTGIVTPARGATVTYGRLGKNPIEITLAPPRSLPPPASAATFAPADGSKAEPIIGLTSLVPADSCHPMSAQPFPIWGRMHAGQEPHPVAGQTAPEPGILIRGTLQVSAHATFSNSLYGLTNLTIPVGSRLETYLPQDSEILGNASPQGGMWWGTVIADPEHVALDVAAATEAPRVALYRPYKTGADIVEISTVGQLVTDPDILDLHIGLVILLFLVGICAAIVKELQKPGDPAKRIPE